MHGRHSVETAKVAGLGPTVIRQVIEDVIALAAKASERVLEKTPPDLPEKIHASAARAIKARPPSLASAWEAL